MINRVPIEELAKEIRTIKRSGPSDVDAAVEKYLEQRLQGVSPTERMIVIEKLARQFKGSSPEIKPNLGLEPEAFSKLFSLLLGKKISPSDLSSEELLEKLAHSLNTVFDTLNQIISVINTTLLGKKDELETIRQIIGSDIKEEGEKTSLQSYLNQIQEAFLVAHKAFQQAAQTKLGQILSVLDPDNIAAAKERGLKFGLLRKAELFDIYKEKFQGCKDWFESGRLMGELLREFENVGQKLYKKETGGTQ
jgi:regulator of replication initiation timing